MASGSSHGEGTGIRQELSLRLGPPYKALCHFAWVMRSLGSLTTNLPFTRSANTLPPTFNPLAPNILDVVIPRSRKMVQAASKRRSLFMSA